MAILEHKTIESSSGFAKEIEESALTMIFDNLQKSQYHYPIPSTVREVACNALDAIKERDAVIEILKGEKKEEDYFIRRDEAIYKDSNFDESYYDLEWLSREKNAVITYVSKDTTEGSDYLSIKDNGVGLGGKRLEGYMKLGYSTKRNSKLVIGKYGLGAKAPLSTQVESYRLITAHNGKKFIFDIYSHKVDSAIPKFNLDKGIENKSYKFANDYVAYYEDTLEKNYVEVIVKTKKHHKQQYISAAKSQLLYLKGIKFFVDSDGYSQEIDITSSIMYEDDKIILANNNQYSKPHIVIDGVSYGYIDFQELELEYKNGNVGIKVAPEEVSVNPSRETVVWNEQTRTTVVNRFKEVVGIASTFVEAELDETDFLKWIQKCTKILANTDRNSTLGRLASLVDKGQITPSFVGDKTIKYKTMEKFFKSFKIRQITKAYDSNKRTDRVQRIEAVSWSDVNFEDFYIQMERTSHHKDLYLWHLANDGSRSYSRKTTLILEPLKLPEDTKLDDKMQKAYYAYQTKILKLMKGVPQYEDVAIPEDWKEKLDNMVEAEDKGKSYDAPRLSKAELRELNEETVYKEPQKEGYWASKITFTIKEWKISYVNSLDDDPTLDKLYYGFHADRELLEFLAEYKDGTKYSNDIKIIAIAKENEKYYKKLKKSVYIRDVFNKIDLFEKTITVDKVLITYNTARLLKPGLDKLQFMQGIEGVDPDIYEKYKEVREYYNYYSTDVSNGSVRTSINEYLDKLVEFQLFVKEVEGNKKLVEDKSLELFGSKEFVNSTVIDEEIYDKYNSLQTFAEPVEVLLNEIKPLTEGKNVNEALEREVKEYINFKLNLE